MEKNPIAVNLGNKFASSKEYQNHVKKDNIEQKKMSSDKTSDKQPQIIKVETHAVKSLCGSQVYIYILKALIKVISMLF